MAEFFGSGNVRP